MSDEGSGSGQGQGQGQGAQPGPGSPSWLTHWGFVLIPAATFVVGLVIGGLVVGVGSSGGGGEPSATETVSVSPSPSESVDTAVVVPRECVRAAETAQQATTLILDNLTAIQNFEGQKIIDMLDQLETLSKETRDLSESCSDVDVEPTGDASPTS